MAKLSRNEECYLLLRGKWHKAQFVGYYEVLKAAKAVCWGQEWTVRAGEVNSIEEHQQQLKGAFLSEHGPLVAAVRKVKPEDMNKAKICRNLGLDYSATLRTLKKAVELGIDLSYASDSKA